MRDRESGGPSAREVSNMRVIEKITDFFINVMAIVILFMFMSLMYNVLGRPTGNAILGVDEMCEYMLPALCFLSLPAAIRQGTSISVDLITMKMPALTRKWVDIFGYAVVFVFTVMVTYLSIFMVADSFQSKQTTILLGFVVWPWQLFVVIGMFFAALESLGRIVTLSKTRF